MDETKLIEILKRKNEIKRLTEEIEELTSELGLASMPVGVYTADTVNAEIVISPNVRFNSDIATEKFPLGPNGENMKLYSAVVDSTLAKKYLTEEEYASCQKVFPKNKVEIKLKA